MGVLENNTGGILNFLKNCKYRGVRSKYVCIFDVYGTVHRDIFLE
jgi:hypothetical protein